MKLEKEIQESIKKNLPQQVGDALKARLEQADKDAELVEELTEKLRETAQKADHFESVIREYKELDSRNALLESREKELEKEISNLQLEKLTYQLAAEKDKTEFSKNIALGLVRNIEYRKNIFDSETLGQPVVDGQGHAYYPMATTKSHTSTETTT